MNERFDLAVHIAFGLIFGFQMWSHGRMLDSFRSMSDQDDRIIRFLAGRLADLSPDTEERRMATELYRAMTRRVLNQWPDRTRGPDDLKTT